MIPIILKYWKVALIGLASVVLAIGFFYVKSLKSENTRLTLEISQNKVALDKLTNDLKANQRALELRVAESAHLANERKETIKSLETIYENNEEACNWSVGVIPDSIFNELCQ
jgi:uncharacterized membrane-anchored protein YhcB (DUF1043 family)